MSNKFAGGIKVGAAQSISISILLRSTTDNTEVTGKVHTDVTASYWRQGGTRQAITPETLAAVDSAFSAGGFKEVDATNQKGVYRFDVPDGAFATGADWVIVTVQVAECYACHREFCLATANPNDVYDKLPASPAAVGSNMGSVTSVSSDVGITQAGADKVWGTAVRSLTTFGSLAADTASAVWATVTKAVTSVANDVGITQAGADKVWGTAARSLTTFGSLAADTASAVWATVTKAVTSVANDVGITQAGADKVWGTAARSLTTFGSLAADAASAVWATVTKTVTSVTNAIVLPTGTGEGEIELTNGQVNAGNDPASIWGKLLADIAIPGSIGLKVKEWLATLGSDNKVIVSSEDEAVNTIIAAVNTIGVGTGSGATAWPYQVVDSNGNVIEGAFVQLYTDSARTIKGPYGITDNVGYVNFDLDSGTYYPTVTYGGLDYNGDAFTVA
jgi:hypothetical protein